MGNTDNEYNMIFMNLMQLMGLHKTYLESHVLFSKHNLSKSTPPSSMIIIPIYIKYHDKCTQRELAETFQVSEAFISKTIRYLEDNEFVTRVINDKNRRQKLLSLTEKGNEFINDFITLDKKLEKKITQNIAPDDLNTFLKVLTQLINENKKL